MIAVSLGRPHRYAVIGAPDYFERHGKPLVPPDLLDHRCIRVRLPNGALYRWQFGKDGNKAQVDVTGPITVDEASVARTVALDLDTGDLNAAGFRLDLIAAPAPQSPR